jgi:hypothetical protein
LVGYYGAVTLLDENTPCKPTTLWNLHHFSSSVLVVPMPMVVLAAVPGEATTHYHLPASLFHLQNEISNRRYLLKVMVSEREIYAKDRPA